MVDCPEHRTNETGEVFIGRVIREHFRNTGLRVGSREDRGSSNNAGIEFDTVVLE